MKQKTKQQLRDMIASLTPIILKTEIEYKDIQWNIEIEPIEGSVTDAIYISRFVPYGDNHVTYQKMNKKGHIVLTSVTVPMTKIQRRLFFKDK